jgi:hypothetical protein
MLDYHLIARRALVLFTTTLVGCGPADSEPRELGEISQADSTRPLLFGNKYHLHNGFQDYAHGFLDTRGYGCEGNLRCVSTAPSSDRDSGSGTWIVRSADGKADGTPVLGGDLVTLENQFGPAKSFLDTRNHGCEGNFRCVSGATTTTRDGPSGVWKIVPDSGSEGLPITEEQTVHLRNGWSGFGGWLDTRTWGCEGAVRCVSASSTFNRDGGSTHWRFEPMTCPEGMITQDGQTCTTCPADTATTDGLVCEACPAGQVAVQGVCRSATPWTSTWTSPTLVSGAKVALCIVNSATPLPYAQDDCVFWLGPQVGYRQFLSDLSLASRNVFEISVHSGTFGTVLFESPFFRLRQADGNYVRYYGEGAHPNPDWAATFAKTSQNSLSHVSYWGLLTNCFQWWAAGINYSPCSRELRPERIYQASLPDAQSRINLNDVESESQYHLGSKIQMFVIQ